MSDAFSGKSPEPLVVFDVASNIWDGAQDDPTSEGLTADAVGLAAVQTALMAGIALGLQQPEWAKAALAQACDVVPGMDQEALRAVNNQVVEDFPVSTADRS